MKQTFVFERRLNRLDAIHVHLGRLDHCNVAMCMVAMLEAEVPVDTMRAAWQRASEAVPRFRDVVRPALGRLGPPLWTPASTFEIDQQLDNARLPRDAGWEAVRTAIDELQSAPFDLRRPPWHVRHLHGAPGGRSVVILKLHHALSDGTALAVMLSKVFMHETIASAGVEIEAIRAPGSGRTLTALIAHERAALAMWRSGLRRVAPHGWRQEMAVAADYRRPRRIGHRPLRRSAMFRIPLDTWKDVAADGGGSVNDLYLAIAAATLRRYSDVAHAPSPRAFRIVMPVDVRDDGTRQDGGNVTGAGIVELTGDSQALHSLEEVRRSTLSARQAALGAKPSLIDATVAFLPSTAQAHAIFRRFANKDLLATNVVVPFECGVESTRVEMVFMVPPVIGPPASLALAHYANHLHLVLNMDAGLIEHPHHLTTSLEATLAEAVGRKHIARLVGVTLNAPFSPVTDATIP